MFQIERPFAAVFAVILTSSMLLAIDSLFRYGTMG